MNIHGIIARITAIVHKILHPTHKLVWKCDPQDTICDGDIVCETCETIFWCRYYDKT